MTGPLALQSALAVVPAAAAAQMIQSLVGVGEVGRCRGRGGYLGKGRGGRGGGEGGKGGGML
jgi:hypothetical protein